ncbi:hypothetical protein WKI65_43985 [Streptomyces sp. MS1.AVA.3]|uniref:hypothetical protein n=1 Tax=Streptomyces decoyicus TaxID=249567 RepID=UPI0030BDF701
MSRASIPRIAWIVKDVADAGWTAVEVIALVSQEIIPARVYRPSGFLAQRLRGAHRHTPAMRLAMVAWWRESRQAQRERRIEWEGDWQPPTSRAVARQVNEAVTKMRSTAQDQAVDAFPAGQDGLADLDKLTREEVIDLRAAADKDPLLIDLTITYCGEDYARRLYTNQRVDQAARLRSTGHLTLHHEGAAA